MENAIPPTDATSTSTEPGAPDEVDWTGQVLGEFRILHRLGRGGMGQVYLAEQTSLKRKVALKLLNPELALNARSLNRFKSEAENVARATHANIVQIYTIGQASGINYIALEYVEGKNLREFIERKGTPEIALGLHIMMQVAAALQRASELGIIHRDIKPENILLTKKGEVKVADFGLSRCFAETSDQVSLTQSQVTMGTPLYMAPEQVERKPVDPRTDIYSFGVTCYHMFAGTPPFRGTSPIEVAYQHVHKEPQALVEVRPDLPAELCMVIQKMMAKKPEERYQSAGEIVRDVNRVCESLNLGTIASVSISSSFIGGAPTHPWPETPAGNSSAWHLYGIGAVVVALIGGIAIGWYQTQRDPAHKNGNGHVHLPDNKPAMGSKPNESDLKKLVQQYLEPETPLQLTTGLERSMVLGRFYIDERRLEEAEQFFGSLQKQRTFAYTYLGRIGHAVTLAFKDEYKASNNEFLVIVQHVERNEGLLNEKKLSKKDEKHRIELDAHRIVWKDTPDMRELVARALHRNHANAPDEFPDKLELYRHPPRPTLRPPAAPMPMNPD